MNGQISIKSRVKTVLIPLKEYRFLLPCSSDSYCTLGFVSVPQAIPKTLLQGDELDHTKAAPIKIILSKKRSDPKFSCVIHGTDEEISRHYSKICHLLDDDLSRRISALLSSGKG